ncbi:MAG: 2-oxo acid dehydrogenase subunit E2 [Saccharofermentanales bacterium]
MTITATFDHRVVDGAYGAAYLNLIKELLKNLPLWYSEEYIQWLKIMTLWIIDR